MGGSHKHHSACCWGESRRVLGLLSRGLSCVDAVIAAVRAQVANKVVELLMVNEGLEVCCQGTSDAARLEQLGTARSRQQAAQDARLEDAQQEGAA